MSTSPIHFRIARKSNVELAAAKNAILFGAEFNLLHKVDWNNEISN